MSIAGIDIEAAQVAAAKTGPLAGCTFADEPEPAEDAHAVDPGPASDDFPPAPPAQRPVMGPRVAAWLREEKARREAATLESLEQELADAHAERDELRRMLEQERVDRRESNARRTLAERMGTITAVAVELSRLMVRDMDVEHVRQWAESEAIEAAMAYAEEIGGVA